MINLLILTSYVRIGAIRMDRANRDAISNLSMRNHLNRGGGGSVSVLDNFLSRHPLDDPLLKRRLSTAMDFNNTNRHEGSPCIQLRFPVARRACASRGSCRRQGAAHGRLADSSTRHPKAPKHSDAASSGKAKIITGMAPEVFANLPRPQAIFIGGG